MDIIQVSNRFGCGRVAVQGAQLLDWTPAGQQPLLWCSDATHWRAGEPIRGGIPLCFPWFGAAPAGPGQATAVPRPAHGFARRLNWALVHQREHVHGSELVFELCDSPSTRALWPQGFVARVTMRLGSCIQLSFSYELSGAAQNTATAALHSYLQVHDIEQVGVLGLGPSYREAGQRQRGGLVTQLHGVTDRIYDAPAPYTSVNDLGHKRTLSLWHRGHSDVVLWNPWQALNDAPDQQWRNFVCVETARITRPLEPSVELAVEICLA